MMRLMVVALLLAVILVPAVGVAFDDHSAAGPQHSLRPQPARGWRTVPAAVDRPAPVPRSSEFGRLDATDAAPTVVPLVRALFVPPRG
jgi:cell division protein FtsN